MSTLLVRSPSVQKLRLCDTSVAETNFERTVIWALEQMFPDCEVFDFKPLISYATEGWRPDLALIDKRGRYWFVVEVETASHSLNKHVVPQVTAFRDGDYGDEAVHRLSECLGSMSGRAVGLAEARTFLQCTPRYVGVVLNAVDAEWERRLAELHVQMVSIMGYSDGEGNASHFVVEGTFLAAEMCLGYGVVVSGSQAVKLFANNNPFWTNKAVYRVADRTGTARWTCIQDPKSGQYWLSRNRGLVDLPNGTTVQFIQMNPDQIDIRPISPILAWA